MIKRGIAVFALAVRLFAAGAIAPGDGRADDIDAAQRGLVERYVAAVAAQDGDNLKKLMHPASLACISEANRDYFDFVLTQDLRYASALGVGYKLSSFAPIDAQNAAMTEMGGLVQNPVPPTHQFQIDTPFDANNRSVTVMRVAAPVGDTWFIVTGCPTEKGLAFFLERMAAAAQQQAHARSLANELRDPLLSEIRALLAEHKRIDAIKRYGAASGADTATAMQVIDTLENNR